MGKGRWSLKNGDLSFVLNHGEALVGTGANGCAMKVAMIRAIN